MTAPADPDPSAVGDAEAGVCQRCGRPGLGSGPGLEEQRPPERMLWRGRPSR